jgi:hypothetical protein
MASFEAMVRTGLGADRVSVMWVKHADKGRLELNFVIPNVDLETGKRFAPYFDRVDRVRFQAWERLTNSLHGFADPSDPARKRVFRIPSDLPEGKLQQQRDMGGLLSEMVGTGLIKNRNELMGVLENGGYKISRKGKDYISIVDRKGSRLRLKGAIYSEAFTSPQSLAVPERGFESDSTDELERKIAERREIFERESEKRRKYINERFPEKNKSGPGFLAEKKSSASDPWDFIGDNSDDGVGTALEYLDASPALSDVKDRGHGHGRWADVDGGPVVRRDNLPAYSKWSIPTVQSKGGKDDDGDRSSVARRIGKALNRVRDTGNSLEWRARRLGQAVERLRNATQELVAAGGFLEDRVREFLGRLTNDLDNSENQKVYTNNDSKISGKHTPDVKPRPPSFMS